MVLARMMIPGRRVSFSEATNELLMNHTFSDDNQGEEVETLRQVRAAEADRLGQSGVHHDGSQLPQGNGPPQVVDLGVAAPRHGNGGCHVDKGGHKVLQHGEAEVVSASAVVAGLEQDDAVLDGENEAGAHEAESCERE